MIKPTSYKPFCHSFRTLRAIKKAQILTYFTVRNRIPNWIPIFSIWRTMEIPKADGMAASAVRHLKKILLKFD